MKRIVIITTLLAATLTTAQAQRAVDEAQLKIEQQPPLDARERAYRRTFPDWEAREARDAIIREQAAARDARRAADAIPQETWINRNCNKYGASSVPSITPRSLSPIILDKLRQKDAPKIEAARQECELRKQQQIEAKAAKEEADRQAIIEAARQETLRKEAEQKAKAAREEGERQATIEAARQEAVRKEEAQKAIIERAERARKDAEARVAMCFGAVPNDKAQELANVAISDVRAKMDLKSPPVDQLVADRLRYLLGQHLNAGNDDKRMPGFTRLTITKQAAAVVACYNGVQQLMKEQVRSIEEAQRAERATSSGGLNPHYIVTTHTFGCVILNEGAFSTGEATGRIFDLSNPDQCRSISVGTLVLSQKHITNATCVVPDGASPPCLWVLDDKLKPAQAKPSEPSTGTGFVLKRDSCGSPDASDYSKCQLIPKGTFVSPTERRVGKFVLTCVEGYEPKCLYISSLGWPELLTSTHRTIGDVITGGNVAEIKLYNSYVFYAHVKWCHDVRDSYAYKYINDVELERATKAIKAIVTQASNDYSKINTEELWQMALIRIGPLTKQHNSLDGFVEVCRHSLRELFKLSPTPVYSIEKP